MLVGQLARCALGERSKRGSVSNKTEGAGCCPPLSSVLHGCHGTHMPTFTHTRCTHTKTFLKERKRTKILASYIRE